jgi:hypothetical protein
MKLNFKKISAIGASILMTGMTMGVAAAANFPAPFVGSSGADVAIVYGANSASSDFAQTTAITSVLNAAMPASGTTITGDTAKLERGSNLFNYGDALNTFYTSLDYEDFEMVLAKGTYLNDDNNEYAYEQTITPSAEALQFFKDSSFQDDVPVMGFDFDRNDLILNYTLSFTPTAAEGGAAVSTDEYPKLDNTEIDILGKTYFISDAEFTSNGIQLTMLDSANTNIVSQGESVNMNVGGKSYDVSIYFVEDGDTARLNVNGEITNSIDEGQTYKLSDGTYVGIKDVSYNSKESSVSSVEFTLGSGKLVLEQGQEVEINDDALSEFEDENGYSSIVTAYFDNSTSTSIDSLTLEWKVNQETWIAPGTDITMPGFNAIKLSMIGWNVPSPESTMIEDDGDSVSITTQIKSGELKLPILYANSSQSGFDGLGKDSTQKLITNVTEDPSFNLNESENSYFVTTWLSGDEAESYAFEIGSISSNSGKNTTKLTNLVSGGPDIEFNTVGDTKDVGQITFTLVASSDSEGTATVKASGSSVYGNLLITDGGMTMKLPVDSATGVGDGYINCTNTTGKVVNYLGAPTSYVMNITEEDKNGNIHTNSDTDKSFTVTLGVVAGEGTEVSDTSLTELREGKSSDHYVAYVASDLATKVDLYNPSSSSSLNSLEITYAGSESYADVYFAEASASTSVAQLGNIVVTDAEVSSVSGKNLIVVGGSCINSVAATLLDGAACGPAFTDKTGVKSGEYIIKSVSDAYTAGKIALVVAGYNAEDTQAGVSYLLNQKPDTAGANLLGTSATSATTVAQY